MTILQIGVFGFLAIAFLGALLYGLSASEAKNERDDSLKQKSHWAAALFGFVATLLFPILASAAVLLSMMSIPEWIEWAPNVLVGLSFIFGVILVLGWGYNEITAHRNSLPIAEVGNQVLRVQRNLCYLVLQTGPNRRFSMDELYNAVCTPMAAPAHVGQIMLARFLGETEADLFGENRVRELFSGMVPTKVQFAEHFAKEAKSRQVTVFSSNDPNDVAIPPTRLFDWPGQPRYLQIGDHDSRSGIVRFFDRLR